LSGIINFNFLCTRPHLLLYSASDLYTCLQCANSSSRQCFREKAKAMGFVKVSSTSRAQATTC
jgi:hypothetical protein